MSGGTIFTGEYCPPGHFVGGQYSLQHRYTELSFGGELTTMRAHMCIIPQVVGPSRAQSERPYYIPLAPPPPPWILMFALTYLACIPYSATFWRCIIFVVFTDRPPSAKIVLREKNFPLAIQFFPYGCIPNILVYIHGSHAPLLQY